MGASPSGYTLCAHADVPGGTLAEQVYALTTLAFGAYPGVLVPSPAHRAWYVTRPGMDRDLSRAALADGRLVASLFVTVARLRLGGRLLPVGVVDTVMTHPAHRRRGLARALLGQALEGMRARGLAASLLYTLEGSMPERFYASLGYRVRARVRYLARPAGRWPAGGKETLRRAERGDAGCVARLLDQCYAACDGYVTFGAALWRWRKEARPAALPAEVWLLEGREGALGTVTVCQADVVGEREPAQQVAFLTDLAVAPGADPSRVLPALAAAAGGEREARTLVAAANAPECAALEALGFHERAVEVAMVAPLSPEGEEAVARPAGRWYALAESVVGL